MVSIRMQRISLGEGFPRYGVHVECTRSDTGVLDVMVYILVLMTDVIGCR